MIFMIGVFVIDKINNMKGNIESQVLYFGDFYYSELQLVK
jgi:hypothetical protein